MSLPAFITIASLPIKIKERKYSPKKTKLPLTLAVEVMLLALLTEVLLSYRRMLSPQLLIIMYSVFTMFFIDILFFCTCWIGKSITGWEVDKPSNKPLLSTSVQEFWGRRWNIAVSHTLRHTIYVPVRRASEEVLGKGLCSTCLGVLVTFVVSGLMHELLYYHMTLAATSWEVTLFFVLHGVVTSIEIVLKTRLGKLRLPRFVSWAFTIGFLSISSWMLHFPQLIGTGVDVKLSKEFQVCVKY